LPRLLIVDDDEDILALLTAFFQGQGYEVAVAQSGAAMFRLLKKQPVDLVILDVMLQGEEGFEIFAQLRVASRLPVIMLTARSDPEDRARSLALGVDDYLTKPFDARKLLARVRTALHRLRDSDGIPPSPGTRRILRFSNWYLDVTRRELRSADKNALVLLSRGEFDLLLAFAEHPQCVLTHAQLFDFSRGPVIAGLEMTGSEGAGPEHGSYSGDADAPAAGAQGAGVQAADVQAIELKIGRLRAKLEDDPARPAIILTVQDGAYVFAAPVSRE